MGEKISGYFAASIGRITAFLPNLISAIVIVAIGYVLSRVARSVTTRLLARFGFDRFVERHAPPNKNVGRHASQAVGGLVFWIGLLVTASMASEALALETLSRGLGRILEVVPRALVAVVIVGVAVALGNVASSLLGGVMAKAARAGVILLGAFMALDQLGVARSIVLTLFTALIGAVAIAAAVAFGIGAIPAARELAARWARAGRGLAEKGGAEPRVPPREPPEVMPH
jgi:hypothetical protein